MPRTCSPTERATIAGTSVNHYLYVFVEDPDGVMRDCTALGGFALDLVDGSTWGETLDSPVMTGQLVLRRDTNADTLAPLMGSSSINRTALGAYAAFLEKGRKIQMLTATVTGGAAPVSGDKKEMFFGRIDRVQWQHDPVLVDLSDQGAWVSDAQIQAPKQYITVAAPGAGPLLGDVIQGMLNDVSIGRAPSPTLYQPVAATFQPYAKDPTQPGSLLAAIRALAQEIGWEVRYRYDASDVSRLTLYEPNRANTVADWTIGPTEYRDVTQLETSIANIRNYIKGYYNAQALAQQFVFSPDPVSIAKYGLRFMQIASSNLITQASDMQALTDAVLSDLSEAAADQEIEMPYFWPVQLGDLITFQANGDHYDSDQTLAVVGYQHKFANGEGSTTIQARGKVAGAFRAWLRREGAPDTTTANSILRITPSESTDGARAMLALDVGPAVDSVHVHYRTVSRDTDPKLATDFSNGAVLPVDGDSVKGPVDGALTFDFPQPARDKRLIVRLVPRYLSPSGTYVEGEGVVFPVNPAPRSINVDIIATKVGHLASLTVEVNAGVSDLPGWLTISETVLGVETQLLRVPVTASTLVLDPAAYSELANRAIPAGADKIEWRAVFTDVSGEDVPFGPVSALPALVDGPVKVDENTTARTATITASLTDAGGYLNPAAADALDPTVHGAVTVHTTLRGIKTVHVCTSIPVSGTTGDYVFTLNIDPTRPILVEMFRHYVDGSTDLLFSNQIDSNKISDVVNAAAVNNGTTANVPVQFDNDTKIGAGFARYSLNGGSSWTTGTVASDFSALFTGIARTSSVQSMILQGQNAIDGLWGNQTTIQIDPFTADVPSLTAQYKPLTPTTGQIIWTCTLGTVTLSIDGGTPSTPSASPIAITLDALTHDYAFVATLGSQTMSRGVAVPALPPSALPIVYLWNSAQSTTADTITMQWTVTNVPPTPTYDLLWSNDNGATITTIAGVSTPYVHNKTGTGGHGYDIVAGGTITTLQYAIVVRSGGVTVAQSAWRDVDVDHA